MVNSTFGSEGLSTLLADSPIPLYVQVADILRDKINTGGWATGTLIPTLEELAQQFDVARVTVRQAVQTLTKEGLLSPKRGLGTLVVKTEDRPNQLVMQTSLQSLASMYESTSAKMLTFSESNRTPQVNPETGKLGKSYVYMRRLHLTEGKPYALISLYLLQSIFQKSPEAFRSCAVIPVLLRTKSVQIDRARQSMSIGTADVESARLLEVRTGTPVAYVTRVFVDARQQILYYAEVVYRGDWVRWEIELQP